MISFMYRSQFTLMICLQCGLYTGSLYIISWVSCFSLCRCKILVQCTVVHGWNHNCLVRASQSRPTPAWDEIFRHRWGGWRNQWRGFGLHQTLTMATLGPGKCTWRCKWKWVIVTHSFSYTWFNQPTWYLVNNEHWHVLYSRFTRKTDRVLKWTCYCI